MENEEFSWTVEAEIYESESPTARIVIQTEAFIADDGYVRFERLGISEITQNLKIRYTIKTPQSFLNSNYTPPSLDSTSSINSTRAEFICSTDQSSIVVGENDFFNLSVSVLDKFSSMTIKDINWKNHTWQTSLGIYQLDKCQPEGTLNTNVSNATALFSNGLINFENLLITKSGMYRLIISIQTTNDDYSFSCISNSIIVTKNQIYLDYTTIPSSYLTFDGNFHDYKNMVEDIKNIVYNCYLEQFSLTLKTPISVYEGSVMINFDYSGDPDRMTAFGQNISQGVEIVPGLSLVSAILNDRQITILRQFENATSTGQEEITSTGSSAQTIDRATTQLLEPNVTETIYMTSSDQEDASPNKTSGQIANQSTQTTLTDNGIHSLTNATTTLEVNNTTQALSSSNLSTSPSGTVKRKQRVVMGQHIVDSKMLEQVQRRATKLVPRIRNWRYEDRLAVLRLTPLHERRVRGDLIQMFKLTKGINEVN
ncbi:RNA-directed DNA polymerase from mobile element jockey-like [Brachionus plicatilis]|uniref:RNA-directed DNA polymerase from mobile element jockey-like n=1 Tax=Brachionus plicatilis TaxID=10195 RepID=A0A3M7RG04_BRAPC|nr:RNA-directed DNA polymerase from mobile element jockey-like [Brachionus plicatilis]